MLIGLRQAFATFEPPAVGQAAWNGVGSFQWVVPDGVTSICGVAVGTGQIGGDDGDGVGGDGGNAGDLVYANNISVTPGETLTVTIGSSSSTTDTTLKRGVTALLCAPHGANRDSEDVVGDVHRIGALGAVAYDENGAAGGGAAGYGANGNTGNGGSAATGAARAGGGYIGIGGGGVGLLGEGTSANANTGQGGSSGENGSTSGVGGKCGGGGGGSSFNGGPGAGGAGGVRIIWGAGRSFPSTLTGDQ